VLDLVLNLPESDIEITSSRKENTDHNAFLIHAEGKNLNSMGIICSKRL